MLKRKMIIIILSALLIATQIGCSVKPENKSNKGTTVTEQDKTGSADPGNGNNNTGKDSEDTEDKEEGKEKAIMDEFDSLISKEVMISEVVAFIDKNISSLSPENAAVLIIGLEKAQEDYLPLLEENINDNKAVRDNIEKEQGEGLDISKADSTKDEELKKLLIEMRDSGYKFETVEGDFFSVINYEFYKKFSQYVTEDIKSYINIMAVESNKVPAKDAGIIISWNEILKRAQEQEEFIKKYDRSSKIDEVRQLYKRYLYFALYGADNTPLFSFDKKIMKPDVKSTYISAAENSGNSEFLKVISDYMDILEKNDYKLTDEVENFRKNIIEEIK